MEDILTDLKIFFNTFFRENLSDNDNLFEVGALDSMGVVSLMTHIEEKYQVAIAPEEVTEVNFGSLKSVAKLVAEKKGLHG